jgi:hypothetical protein
MVLIFLDLYRQLTAKKQEVVKLIRLVILKGEQQ